MKELNSYLKTLSERNLFSTYRELKSRFIRGSVRKAIRRVMQACERYNKKYVFFIVGSTVEYNKDFIKEIINRGHSIGCHGYLHLRHDIVTREEAFKDIKDSIDLFKSLFNYRLEGYRAPYLGYNNQVVDILKELNFRYSSSIRENSKNSIRFENEILISVDDWDCLIKRNGNWKTLYNEMEKGSNRTAYLIHPWRVGQKKHVNSLRLFLEHYSDRVINVEDYLKGDDGIVLTGDIGELSLIELFKRIIKTK